MASSQKKTYLVTGAAGFIGSRFVESCNELGISLISVDRLPFFDERPEKCHLDFGKKIDLEELFGFLASTSSHRLVGRNRARLPEPRSHDRDIPRLDELKIDAIIHLGAITDTRESDLGLLEKLNLEYTQSLWKFATEREIPLVYASSAATYGDGAFGYDDDESQLHKLVPLNAYGDSKQHFDLWALEQEKAGSHPPGWCGFKFFNVYGFGERHKGFMASVVLHSYDEILRSGKVTLFRSHKAGIEDGYQKRDFISVEDVVKALHFAVDHPISRGIYNLGSGQARPFIDLARAVFQALGKPEKIEFIDTPEKIRDKYQYFTEARMSRLRRAGFELPFTSLEAGVRQYVARLSTPSA